jgi:hypothetical protein
MKLQCKIEVEGWISEKKKGSLVFSQAGYSSCSCFHLLLNASIDGVYHFMSLSKTAFRLRALINSYYDNNKKSGSFSIQYLQGGAEI